MQPDTESLRCFEAVADRLSFRAAAVRVSLSPAALSERIRRLEADLGETLFLRSSRKVTLTPAGERLLPQVRVLLEAHARCLEVVRESPAPGPLELWLGCRIQLVHSWLLPALPHLERPQARRRINLRVGETKDLVNQVRQRQLDATIANSGFAEGPLESCDLHEEQFILVGAARLMAGHPLASPEDAAGHVLLDMTPDLPLSRYFLNAAGGSARWHFQRLQFLGTLAGVRIRALQGGGVAVLPTYFAAHGLASGRLVRLLPDLPLPSDRFHLVWRRDHPRAAELRGLAEELRRIPLH